MAESLLAMWVTPTFRDSAPGRGLATILARTPDEGYAACCEALASVDNRPHVEQLRCPVTVAVGEHDEATPRALADQLAQAIGCGPVHVIPGVRHLPTMEAAGTVTELVRATIGRAG